MKCENNKYCCGRPNSTVINYGPMGPVGPTGPTGPTGEQGPEGVAETILIRNTTTGAPLSSAQVIDVGTVPNHVLDFVIPQGPTGTAGLDGVSDRIAVENTVTLDAGLPATVEDNFSMGVHNLTFSIPKGADAVTNNLAVAQLYKTTTQTLTAIGQNIDFSINQNFRNSLTTQQTIQVLNGGTYKIEFGFTFSAVNNLELALYVDDLEMSNTTLLFNTTTLHNNGVYLVELDANNELSIRVQSITGDATLPADILNAYLIVTPAG